MKLKRVFYFYLCLLVCLYRSCLFNLLVFCLFRGPTAALSAGGRSRQGSIGSRQRSLTGDSLALFKQRTIQRGVGGAGVKRHSVSLQTKFKLVGNSILYEAQTCVNLSFVLQDILMDMLRKTQQTFIHCISPHNLSAFAMRATDSSPRRARSTTDPIMDVPFVRNQLRRVELLNALRIHRQGLSLVGHYHTFCSSHCFL